jgi:hypothetical protein
LLRRSVVVAGSAGGWVARLLGCWVAPRDWEAGSRGCVGCVAGLWAEGVRIFTICESSPALSALDADRGRFRLANGLPDGAHVSSASLTRSVATRRRSVCHHAPFVADVSRDRAVRARVATASQCVLRSGEYRGGLWTSAWARTPAFSADRLRVVGGGRLLHPRGTTAQLHRRNRVRQTGARGTDDRLTAARSYEVSRSTAAVNAIPASMPARGIATRHSGRRCS